MPVSIRSRLLLLVLSVLLPAVLAALWVIFQTYHAERAALERNLRDTTRAMTTVIDRELTQRAAIARVLASAQGLQQAPAVGPEALRQFETQARASMDGLAGWVELRSQTQVLVDTRRAAFAPPQPAPAARALAESPAVLPLSAGADGAPATAGVVHPVQDDGRTLLNVAVMLRPGELQAVIDTQRLPPTWVGTVLDDRGMVVARHPGAASFVGRSATADLREHILRQREGAFESVSLDGTAVTGYYSTSPQGWVFIGAMPQSEIAAGVRATAWKVALGSIVLLALAVAGALWVSRRVVAPMQALRQAATRLRAGEPVEAASTGIVEYDQVAAALATASTSIREANAELARQVDAAVRRTREAEQRVSHNQRVEALGRLTGGVAHDFNNLLGVISNSAHLIKRLQVDAPVQAPIDAMLRAVDVGSRLTQQLLRFAGRQPLRPAPVDLARTLPELQELMQTVLGKRVIVTTRVAPGTRVVTIDPSELELALINVGLNARDAMPSGGHLWLGARNAERDEVADLPPGDHVLITITDDGHGIDEALAERVFEPFFTTKPMGKGTGLGLSQVHGFCVQAGGTARLASTPGLGTTVTLVLPARDTPAAAPAGVPAEAAGDTAGLAGKRVLLVEDNEELADVTAALLGTYGSEVRRAASPREALAHLEAGPAFDVVLSDIVMPGDMDGIALARQLRTQRPELPVVLISGYSEALQQAREFTVLRKPTTPQQLVTTLRTALAAPRASGATPVAPTEDRAG